ncbi:MAG: hypothetical protein JWN93_389 [Hyphomicrobiales bacterium]|nr:hypothetical protein [Hyphomicrobiales bacterium]
MKRIVLAAALGLLALASPASAQQEFPSREIRLVCGFAAGSGADMIHRYFAKELQALTGKAFVVENKPGVSGNLAHSYAAKARPDGHTVYLVGGNTLAASLHLFKQPPVDPVKEFEPIGTLLRQGWLVVVDAKSPAKSLPELTELLKKKGAGASYATATVNGTVVAEMYKQTAGLDMVQVQYRTIGDSLNDLLSGRIDVMMADSGWALGHIRSGRLRALAVSTTQRQKSMPDLPTMAEGGVPGIDVTSWWMVQLPAGTPQPIADKLRGWFDAVLRAPETEQFLTSIGTDLLISTPAESRDLLRKDIENWRQFVARAKIDPT